jgi:hypothetical protein
MQQILAPVSNSALILGLLIFTKTLVLLGLLREELSFRVVLFINSLYNGQFIYWGTPVSAVFFAEFGKMEQKGRGGPII